MTGVISSFSSLYSMFTLHVPSSESEGQQLTVNNDAHQ